MGGFKPIAPVIQAAGVVLSFTPYYPVGIGLMALGSIIAASGKQPNKPGLNTNVEKTGFQLNTTSSRNPLPLLYGVNKTGCNRVYINTVNPYLHMILEFGEGPIAGIIREDGSLYDTTATELPTSNPPLIYFDDKLWTEYNTDLIYMEWFSGSSGQDVCSTLNAIDSQWDQALRYTTYLYVQLKYDPDEFKNFPEVTMKTKGLLIYNPITQTVEYTNNAALCAYDFITRSALRGGLGIQPGEIDSDTLSDSIDYCTAKGWTCNMPISQRQAGSDNLEQILANYRGDIIYSDDSYKFLFRDLNYESTVMVLTEDDIISTDGVSSLAVTQPDSIDRPNAIRVTYISEDKNNKPDDFVKTDTAAIASEGDYREQEIKCYGLSTQATVQAMANYYLERFRWNKTIELTMGNRGMALEPMDIITLDHTMPGWTGKMLRVISGGIMADHTVSLSCIEEKIQLYDDIYNLTAHDWHDTNLPAPTDQPPGVYNVSESEEVYYFRERSFTRWKINFDRPNESVYPFWDYAEIWLKIGSDDWRYQTTSEGNYVLDPVEEGETYYLKIRSVSIFGQKETFGTAHVVSRTINGKTESPSDLASLSIVANGDSVSIYSNPITDPDIEGYEIRLGSAWDGGLFMSLNKNISLRLNGVRPGTHTFWAAAKGNNGVYSDVPVSASVTVFIQPGYSELATYGSWSWDFTTGSHSNTEHTTYDAEDALKCSHGSSVLAGTWTSATFDLNSIVKVRLWGDFRTAFVSGDTTWDGVIPSPNVWPATISTLTWNEIFQPAQAGQIQATLMHKQLVGDSWTEVDFFEILCAEVEARYIAVAVTITDPTLDSNLYLKTLNMYAYEGPQ